jgi:crotonobetainyl-CoA:carnitine CoA-transferase CaiB-like acyl-CoA transferase
MMLADLGADVIKVERSGEGDPYRTFKDDRYAPHFQANNRNKRSIALDLSDDGDRDVLSALVRGADVFIQNFRPGVADKLGFGWAQLSRLNPQLIYCSISGFGSEGPYVDRPAYDTVAQAFSGYLSMFVDPKAPRVVGPAAADTITGLYATIGILAGLVERSRTRRGRHVETSMVGAMTAFAAEPFSNYFNSGVPWGPYDRATISQSYALGCKGGDLLALHLSSPPKFWNNLLAAIERPDLAQDPRFATRMGRVQHHAELNAVFQPIFAERTRDEWRRRLEEADVPHAPILSLAEALQDTQLKQMHIERTDRHPTRGLIRSISRPLLFDGERDGFEFVPAPELDEHGEQIRKEIQSQPGAK